MGSNRLPVRFLAHLSWRLKLSIVVVVVNFTHFHFLGQFQPNLAQRILGWSDSSLIKWRTTPFSKRRLLRNSKITFTKFKNLLKNHCAQCEQTGHKASLSKGYSSLFKWRAPLFPRGDNYEIGKIHWRNWKIFFSRFGMSIARKLNTINYEK